MTYIGTEPNEAEKEGKEKEEPRIEFLLAQDLDLGESHAPILTPTMEGFLKIVLGKVRTDPGKRQPVFVRIQGFTEKEISTDVGYIAELLFFGSAFIYRATYIIKRESIEDLAELFLVNLEANVAADGCRGVFI